MTTPKIPPRPGAIASSAGLVIRLVMALGLVGFLGCGASARSLLIDGTQYGQKVADESAPRIEKACVTELPTLKQPVWGERVAVCDVVVPANDELATAVAGAKKMLAAEAESDAGMLAKVGELAIIAAKVVAQMVKIGVDAGAAMGGPK